MALIQYSFRSEVLKENTEIYVILPTYEVFRDPEKKGAETYYKEYERKKTLPLTHDPKERYVIGNSMGSHGTFKWALNRPDFFAAAAGMSGAGEVESLGFFDMNNPNVASAFGTREEYRGSSNDFYHLIRKNLQEGKKLPRLYSCCGRQDFFYEGSKNFAEVATKMGCPVEFSEGEGRHEWGFWDQWLPVMIDKMMKEDV